MSNKNIVNKLSNKAPGKGFHNKCLNFQQLRNSSLFIIIINGFQKNKTRRLKA